MNACKLCGKNPAEVPDRNSMGRPVKRVCKECHAKRLRADLQGILKMREKVMGKE